MIENLLNRYLKILGIDKKNPDLNLLNEIVKSHLLHLPFENISKIYYKKFRNITGIPDPQLFLDGVEKNHFGGTCFTLNYYLNLLLHYLGFNVRLCGADMSKPDMHIMNIVTMNNSEYIVDAGYAAPLLVPIPRGLKEDFVIERGDKKYLIKPQDENRRTKVEMYEQNVFEHSYTAKPESRKIEEFKQAIEDSYNKESLFIKSLYLTRFYENKTIVISNLKFIEESENDTAVKDIGSREELIELIKVEFNIRVEITESVLGEFSILNEKLSKL